MAFDFKTPGCCEELAGGGLSGTGDGFGGYPLLPPTSSIPEEEDGRGLAPG